MKTLKHLLTALLLMVATVAMAHDFEVGGIYYNIADATNKMVEVTYSGSSSSLVSNEYTGSVDIPAVVTYNDATYSVISIGIYAFRDCSGLTSVTIPTSVTKIGACAFEDCAGLENVTIPNSVVELGSHAFDDCTALKSLCLEDGSEPISCVILSGVHTEDYFFEDSPIEYMYIGRDLNNFSFKRNKGWQRTLKEVIIGDGMTSIPNSIFDGCYELSSITISDNVSYIGNDAFYSCI